MDYLHFTFYWTNKHFDWDLVIIHVISYQLSCGVVQPISELESTLEEADTQMLLHSLHAARQRFASVVIVSEDTDVLVLLLAFKSFIPSSVFIKCGSQTRVKYIEVSRIVESVGAIVCRSLPGFHAFSGCDTVSAFAGRGKVVGYRIATRNVEFQEMFQQLGMEWNLSDDLHHSLQKFTCAMYCSTPGKRDISMSCDTGCSVWRGEVESNHDQLPPCNEVCKDAQTYHHQ